MSTATPSNPRNDDPLLPEKKRPKWIPITLLAASAVALAIPLVYLRRAQSSLALNSVSSAPPRRTVSLAAGSSTASPFVPMRPRDISLRFTFEDSESLPDNSHPDDSFNAVTHTLKAFSLATLLVGSGAFIGLWSIRTFFDVHDVHEFGDQMRLLVSTRMPVLYARIHKALRPEEISSPSLCSAEDTVPSSHRSKWTWSEAEERLRAAFDKGGLEEWARAAAVETEQEAKAVNEERKRLMEASKR